jgi:hypothetical protein
LAKWLYNYSLSNQNGKININILEDWAFVFACNFGHIEVAKWLYSLGGISISSINRAFCYSCEDGKLEVAKWLFDLDKQINIHADNDYAFKMACMNGHINVSKWLYSLNNKIDIHIDNDFAIKMSYKEGHIEMVQWLDSLDKGNFPNNFYSEQSKHIEN